MRPTRGRPKTLHVITPEDRRTLESFVRRRTTAQRLALRSRIMVGCTIGVAKSQVAEELQVTSHGRQVASRFIRREIAD